MLDRLIRYYAKRQMVFSILPKTRWVSLTIDLKDFTAPQSASSITVKPATEEDIKSLQRHTEVGEGIFSSALRFWKDYGFRCLMMGYYENESDPSVFQYAIDHTANNLYENMEYGEMYLPQNEKSVQVENLYVFKVKRRKNIALNFEWQLFDYLKNQGKMTVRTHISAQNIPTIRWAKKVGLCPDSYIVGVDFDMPYLRSCRKRFFYTSIRREDLKTEPLSIFQC